MPTIKHSLTAPEQTAQALMKRLSDEYGPVTAETFARLLEAGATSHELATLFEMPAWKVTIIRRVIVTTVPVAVRLPDEDSGRMVSGHLRYLGPGSELVKR